MDAVFFGIVVANMGVDDDDADGVAGAPQWLPLPPLPPPPLMPPSDVLDGRAGDDQSFERCLAFGE